MKNLRKFKKIYENCLILILWVEREYEFERLDQLWGNWPMWNTCNLVFGEFILLFEFRRPRWINGLPIRSKFTHFILFYEIHGLYWNPYQTEQISFDCKFYFVPTIIIKLLSIFFLLFYFVLIFKFFFF